MPVFKRPEAELYYEVHGSGFPLLLFAPGGLRSQLSYWRESPSSPGTPPAWMNPMAALGNRFTVIGMDQRNAGQSRGVVRRTDGWHTYAADQSTWDEAVAGFGKTMLERDKRLTPQIIGSFGRNVFGGEFVFSVSREFVRECRTPLYLQPGTDVPHPAKTSEEIAALAPNIEVQKDWRGPTHLEESIRRVGEFLARNTPA